MKLSKLCLPARSTMVIVLPVQQLGLDFRRFLTSTQKNPWLRELAALLPVPATRRSVRPVSITSNASSMLPQTTFFRPATTFLSGEDSVLLYKSALLLMFAEFFALAVTLARRSKIRSL